MADTTDDKIVYTVVTKPGGVDGRDHTDKGGVVKYANYSKHLAMKAMDAWTTMVPIVVDTIEARKKAMAKLDPIDQLILGLVS